MDHSVRGYLSRQPTEVLQHLLHHYLQDGVWQDYFRTVPIIIEILKQRGINISQEICGRIAEIELQAQEIAPS